MVPGESQCLLIVERIGFGHTVWQYESHMLVLKLNPSLRRSEECMEGSESENHSVVSDSLEPHGILSVPFSSVT